MWPDLVGDGDAVAAIASEDHGSQVREEFVSVIAWIRHAASRSMGRCIRAEREEEGRRFRLGELIGLYLTLHEDEDEPRSSDFNTIPRKVDGAYIIIIKWRK